VPNSSSVSGTLGEWRTCLDALQKHRERLQEDYASENDEDRQLLIYDDLERLDGLIAKVEAVITVQEG